MPGRWGEIPFGALLPCLVLGIQLARWLPAHSFVGMGLGGAALAVAAALAFRRRRDTAALFLGLLSLVLSGLLLQRARSEGFAESDVRAILTRGSLPRSEPVLFEGCVVEDGRPVAGDLVATVALRAYRAGEEWVPARGNILLRLALPAADDEPLPAASLIQGDRVRGWAQWDLPRGFLNPGSADRRGNLARRGVHLTGRVKSARLLETIPGDCGSPASDAVARIRRSIRARLEALGSGDDPRPVAVLAGIILGDHSKLSAATRESFQSAGVYHVLVVSGLHVGWIAWSLGWAFTRLRLRPDPARLLVLLTVLLYVSIVGFRASTTRCLWMLILYLAGQLLFRRADPAGVALGSAFAILALRPDWLLDPGFQLSYLSVLGIFLMGLPWLERGLRPALDPLRHAGRSDRIFVQPARAWRRGRRARASLELLAESAADRWHPALEGALLAAGRACAHLLLWVGGILVISVAVQLWIGPVLAFHFNRVTWIAPLANLAAVPLASLALVAGALGIAASFLPWELPALGGAPAALASLLLTVTDRFARMEGAWQRCAIPPAEWVAAAIAILFFWRLLELRRGWLPGLLSLGLVLALAWGPGLRGRSAGGALRITFLDVGQGDAQVLEFPDGSVWILDAGGLREPADRDEGPAGLDIGEAVVSRYLWQRWTPRLERVLLTHPHQDHAGGIPALFRNFPVGRFDYGEVGPDPTLQGVLDAAAEKKIPALTLRAGDEMARGGVRVRVLNPAPGAVPRSVNDGSIVLHLRFGGFAVLLTGDVERTGEAVLLGRSTDLESLLLKVAHHGSRSSTPEFFLERVRPRWGVVSAGKNNPFGHPAPEVLARLLRHGALPLLTAEHGAITIETDGSSFRLSSFALGLIDEGPLR